jgi:hypothetical protein
MEVCHVGCCALEKVWRRRLTDRQGILKIKMSIDGEKNAHREGTEGSKNLME